MRKDSTIEIGLEDKKLELLSQLNQFYLESRYPGERIQLAKAVDKNKATRHNGVRPRH